MTTPSPAARVDEEAVAGRVAESALRCLDRALAAMNEAVTITTERGPGAAMEHIADFLNDTDGIDEAVADVAPDDWLTRWQVTRTEPTMTAPSPAGLSPLLDQLDEARAAVAVGAWEVTDDEHRHGVHEYGIWVNDGEHGRYVVEVIPSPADAALIVAAVNALPLLVAAVRGVLALADELETGTRPGLIGFAYDQMADRIRSALAAALTPGADTAGATA